MTKKWERWTQKTKEFPKPKYNFTTHLVDVGDWVQTHPLSFEDYVRIKDAAKFWAWHHGVRVAVTSAKVEDDKRLVTVRLISKTRKREDPTVYDMYKILTDVK